MSTRLTKSSTDQNSIPTGYEGNNVPDDFQIPTCTIEDVDRALFHLFDKDLPLLYKVKEGMNRIPVPGQAASRRKAAGTVPLKYRGGRLLEVDIGKNIMEVITIPPVKYYTSTYEVTFWAQYTQQMNDMIMAMMSLYQNNHKRTFRLETDKGYWFVASVGDSLSPGNNFDDFTDNERIVRYSFEVTVPGYIVGGGYPGAPSFLRKFVSAPEISFDNTQVGGAPFGRPVGSVPSGLPDRYMLQDISPESDPIPGAAIAEKGQIIGGPDASSDSRDLGKSGGFGAPRPVSSTTIGGFTGGAEDIELVSTVIDPFTGKKRTQLLKIKTRNQRKGETVYREQITNDLDAIT
jgi:hypothetical protein